LLTDAVEGIIYLRHNIKIHGVAFYIVCWQVRRHMPHAAMTAFFVTHGVITMSVLEWSKDVKIWDDSSFKLPSDWSPLTGMIFFLLHAYHVSFTEQNFFNIMFHDYYDKFVHEKKMQKSHLGISADQRSIIANVLTELKGPEVSRQLDGKLNIIKYDDIEFEQAIGNGR